MKKLLLVFVLLFAPLMAWAGSGVMEVRWWDRDMCVTFDHCEETFRLEWTFRINVLPEGGLWDKFEFSPVVQNLKVRDAEGEGSRGHAAPIQGWFGFEAAWKPVTGMRLAIGGTSEHFFDGRVDTYNDDNGVTGRVGNYLDIRWEF